MNHWLQGALGRALAVGALVLGAAIALVLAVVTLVSGLVIGLVVTLAAWLGTRSYRNHVPGRGRRGGGREEPGREVTVIDVEMREIADDERAAAPRADADAHAARPSGRGSTERGGRDEPERNGRSGPGPRP